MWISFIQWKKKHYQNLPTKLGNDSVMILELICCFKVTCYNWWNHEVCSLPENPEEECLAITSCPELQEHVCYAAGQFHLWWTQTRAKQKQNKGFECLITFRTQIQLKCFDVTLNRPFKLKSWIKNIFAKKFFMVQSVFKWLFRTGFKYLFPLINEINNKLFLRKWSSIILTCYSETKCK